MSVQQGLKERKTTLTPEGGKTRGSSITRFRGFAAHRYGKCVRHGLSKSSAIIYFECGKMSLIDTRKIPRQYSEHLQHTQHSRFLPRVSRDTGTNTGNGGAGRGRTAPSQSQSRVNYCFEKIPSSEGQGEYHCSV